MSSAFKTLKTSDVTVTPYVTNKSYTIRLTTANATAYGLAYNLFNSQTTIGTGPTYDSSALYYRSVRHLYYSNYLPSLSPTIPIAEQSYSELEEDQSGRTRTKNTLIYDNYLQSSAASGSFEVDDRFDFKDQIAINGTGSIFSIPQVLFGEYITPNSFQATWNNGTIVLTDDGNGNIIDTTASNIKVGNIIYAHGIVVVWRPNYEAILDPALNTTSITFKATFTIYENQTRCHVNENELNITQNPSAASGSTGLYNNNVTGSDFTPYVTTIGLYNAANQLLAVGKLGQPYPVPSNTDITFVIKYDS